MEKPIRPALANAYLEKILREVENGRMSTSEGIHWLQSVHVGEEETLRALIFCADYEIWRKHRATLYSY